jgi:hypothetical protein
MHFIFWVIILAIPSLSSDPLNCPKLGKDKRPALLFFERNSNGGNIYAAYLQDGALARESIASGRYHKVTQLDNAIFLLNTGQLNGSIYAMDFDSGTLKFVSDNGMIWCLRAEPARKKAMLIDSRRGSGRARLIEFDLTSLTTASEQILSAASLGEEYGRMVHRKISPDFQQIAYVSRKGTKPVERISNYELKSLDLRTYATKVLDDNVRVEISIFSSYEYGIPPFEWISNNQVLYQDMIAQESTKENESGSASLNGQCVFKIVDIKTGNISERFRKEIRLELNGGRFETDPLTNRLTFNDSYILDYVQNKIVDKNLPFTVSSFPSRKTEIRSAAELLYSGTYSCVETSLSKSGINFAYLLAVGDMKVSSEIYAVFNGSAKPLKVSGGTGSMSQIIGWIE